VSYNFAESSDLGSADADGVNASSVNDAVLPSLTPSDFDILHSFAGALSYEVPAPSWDRVGNAILKGWSVDGLVRVTSAPPINVIVREISPVFGPYRTQPDIVPVNLSGLRKRRNPAAQR
jgi:hypothetical protein